MDKEKISAKDEPISLVEKNVYMSFLEKNILGIICDCYAYEGVEKPEATRHQAVVTRRIAHWIQKNYELKPKFDVPDWLVPF